MFNLDKIIDEAMQVAMSRALGVSSKLTNVVFEKHGTYLNNGHLYGLHDLIIKIVNDDDFDMNIIYFDDSDIIYKRFLDYLFSIDENGNYYNGYIEDLKNKITVDTFAGADEQ